MSKCYIHAIRQLVHEIFCTQAPFGISPAVTLKNRSKSPKPNQLFTMSHANLVEICQPVHEIWYTTSTFWLKFGSLSHTVTLKIKSRSPKPNQLFIMSQCYIHANLVKIHPQVRFIRYRAYKKVSRWHQCRRRCQQDPLGDIILIKIGQLGWMDGWQTIGTQ